MKKTTAKYIVKEKNKLNKKLKDIELKKAKLDVLEQNINDLEIQKEELYNIIIKLSKEPDIKSYRLDKDNLEKMALKSKEVIQHERAKSEIKPTSFFELYKLFFLNGYKRIS